MGCGGSVSNTPRRRISGQPSKPSNNRIASEKVDISIEIPHYFEFITSGCKKISAPYNLMPSVCLGRNSFPIVTSVLRLDMNTPFEIKLPVISASIFGQGQVLLFSQLDFMNQNSLKTEDTYKLIQNSFKWITRGTLSMTPFYAIQFDKQSANILSTACKELGFFTDIGDFLPSYNNYKSLIIPSTIEFIEQSQFDQLVDYVEKGGGLIIFYINNESTSVSMPINQLLYKFNLAFTCGIMNDEKEPLNTINVYNVFTYVRECNLLSHIATFKNTIKNDNPDPIALDEIITNLRYFIMVCDCNFHEELISLLDDSWEFLRRTGYNENGLLCTKPCHPLIAILLTDLYTKVPPENVDAIPEHKDFPGATGNIMLSTFEEEMELGPEMWVSTGLYLPAGTIGEIEIAEPMSDVHIHIGCHHESLVPKTPPWKRWPLTVCVFPLVDNVTRVVSPFGGIVYVAMNIETDEPVKIHIKFQNFCRHPVADYRNPNMWESTKSIDVPWGEIVAENIIITLPTKKMHEIGDFSGIFDIFSKITRELSENLSYPITRPYRFVFDIELPDEEPSYGYPLVFLEDDIDGIINSTSHPSLKLFNAVTLLGIVSIREDCFDKNMEKTLASITTSNIFRKIWPNFDPIQLEGFQEPTLFSEFWLINTQCSNTILKDTLKVFQSPDFVTPEVPEDMWTIFVKEMCKVGKKNFTGLLSQSKPIPINICLSLQSFPDFKPNANTFTL